MIGLLRAAVSGLVWIISTLGSFFKGSTALAFFTYIFSSIAFKAVSALGIGYITFDITTEFLDHGKQVIASEFASAGSGQYGYLIVDLITTLRLDQAVSIVFSAITIAFTLKSYKWAITAFGQGSKA